jgi:osmotically-inducible protein OsmY
MTLSGTPLAREVEQRLRDDAELFIAVAEDGGRLVLTGLLSTESERAIALDVVHEVAPDIEVDDNLEVDGVLPGGLGVADVQAGAGIDAGESTLEPGDFTDQTTIRFGEEAAGPTSAFEDDEVSSGAEVFVPPIDPVGTDREVIGGLQASSLDAVEVELSALDGMPGDEAIRDAILRELREDAQTRDLELDVEVTAGQVLLSGHVLFLQDIDAAQEVAARVPGVLDVDEQLGVDGL